MTLHFTVHGLPAAQGSKRHVGRGVMVESSKRVKPWRQDVVAAALRAIEDDPTFEMFTGPVEVNIDFFFARPKSHSGTGRNAGVLEPRHPPTSPPGPISRSSSAALTMPSRLPGCGRTTRSWSSTPGPSGTGCDPARSSRSRR